MPSARTLFLSSISLIALAFLLESARDTYLSPNIYCYTSILTLDPLIPSARCLSVSRRDGTIVRIHPDLSTVDTKRKNVQLHEGHVIPGLWDGHGHVLQYGETLESVDLVGTRGLDDVKAKVKVWMAGKGEGVGSRENWIRGMGWDQGAEGWEGRMPTAADLEADEDLNGKYIMFDRIDVHCVWVSQAVLDLLPTPLPESVPGGEIIRDPGLGVFCDNAMDLVKAHLPPPSDATRTTWIRGAMENLNALGIVGVHDAGVTPHEIQLYKSLVSSPEWTVRIYAMLECAQRNTFCPDDATKIERRDGLLTLRAVKLFADGALGSWGSAMLEPYSDRPGTSGTMLLNGSTLADLTHAWSEIGFQVNIHAIGDLAARLSLTAMRHALFSICPDTPLATCQEKARFRLEHAQIISQNDQIRMLDMGVIPSMQPTHATSDMAYAESRLGKERLSKEAYRMRSLLPLQPIFGSDFPVEPPSVFEGVYAAATRKSPRTGLGRNGDEKGWYTDETVSLTEALEGFTLNVARGGFMEGKAGVLKSGSWGDWVVLDRAFGEGGVEEVRFTGVKETWVGGWRVFKRDG